MTSTPRLLATLAALVLLPAVSPSANAQDRQRADQVWVRNPRTGAVSITNAVVKTNGLDDVVVVDARGGEEKIPSGRVVRIAWGDAPASLKDGIKYSERGDWKSAAEKYLIAAGDASARDVVKASARLGAARALLRWGAAEPVHFNEAVSEAQTFLAEFPENRDVPQAQLVEARALLLSGNSAEAGAAYRRVFEQYAADEVAEGYDRMTCMHAGLTAARAMLLAEDTLAAREVFTALDTAVGPLLAGLPPDDPKQIELQAILDEALLGEGFAELVAGNSKPALTFFENKRSNIVADSSDTMRSLVALGLGESLLAEDRVREAQMQFARVSALDHRNRDRVARAQVRLAECELKLLDQDFKKRAVAWLEAVEAHYGDTPAAARARELLPTVR